MQDDTAQRARDAIARQDIWYHKIEVAPGVWTPGTHNSTQGLELIQMPEDLTGMRVLDIGARDGFYTFEAERRGAREVVALDYESADNTGFSIAAELLGSKATFVNDNVYALNPEEHGTFDLILFLGVIYHLRHPLLALDRIHDVCAPEGLLMIETHMIDEGVVDHDGEFRPLADYHADLAALPLVQYYPENMLANDYTSQWAPNRYGARGLAAGIELRAAEDLAALPPRRRDGAEGRARGDRRAEVRRSRQLEHAHGGRHQVHRPRPFFIIDPVPSSDRVGPVNICTIIARNYVAHARVLAESFRQHPPRGHLQRARHRRPDAAASIRRDEPFELLTIDEIGLPDAERMAASYDVLELSTAVKPWLLRHLLDAPRGRRCRLSRPRHLGLRVRSSEIFRAGHGSTTSS